MVELHLSARHFETLKQPELSKRHMLLRRIERNSGEA
jgi:hypothetical protein